MVRVMAPGVAAQDTRLARAAAVLFVAAIWIRSLVSIAAGFIEWHDTAHAGFPESRLRAGDVLVTFGTAGDGAGILLAVVAAAAVWWCLRVGAAGAGRLRSAVAWSFGIVVALAVLSAVGVGLLESFGSQASRTLLASGFALAYAVVAVGCVVLLRQYDAAINELAFEHDVPDVDAFVFAVDRRSGDVRAFLSARQAVRGMHVYWVEDDEFDFYTDEGLVLDASVADERIVLRPTETVRLDELLVRLGEFVARRGIDVDAADADDPAAYAVPIARWQGLEMWPPWLRPLGRLFQPRG
jgi:TRAP-type C4-dicarboxylate transport system permease small subunit